MVRSTQPIQIPVSEPVEDMSIYPRHTVDSTHVTSLVAAREAGETLPPIVLDKASRRIVDGWHRNRAEIRFGGPEAMIAAIIIDYPDKAAIILDAVRRNAAHGRRLDAVDRTRSVIMLRCAGCDDGQIADALNLTQGRVEKLSVRLATAPKSSHTVVPGTSQVVLKRPVAHLAGRSITRTQANAMRSVPGTSYTLLARQLREALENRLANLDDENLVSELRALQDAIATTL